MGMATFGTFMKCPLERLSLSRRVLYRRFHCTMPVDFVKDLWYLEVKLIYHIRNTAIAPHCIITAIQLMLWLSL